jgi:4-amino-4-deoxychorismate lyase
MTCTHTLSENPATAGLKHLNRLDQVLASLELSSDCPEGLICNSRGHLVEGIKSNVFLVKSGTLVTPQLDLCGVAGIQRDVILAMCRIHQLPVQVREVQFAEVHAADEVFLCNSVFGIWPVIELRGTSGIRHLAVGAITRSLQNLVGSTY